MEGLMYEAAASNSKQLRQEEMREMMVNEAAAAQGMPHRYMSAATFPMGQGLPQEQQNTAAALHQAWAAQAAGSMAQQQAQNLVAQFGAQQAANMHAAQFGPVPPPQPAPASPPARLLEVPEEAPPAEPVEEGEKARRPAGKWNWIQFGMLYNLNKR